MHLKKILLNMDIGELTTEKQRELLLSSRFLSIEQYLEVCLLKHITELFCTVTCLYFEWPWNHDLVIEVSITNFFYIAKFFISSVFSFSVFWSSSVTDIFSSISLTWKNIIVLHLIFPFCFWYGVFHSLRDVMIGFVLNCKCNGKSFLKMWNNLSQMFIIPSLCWMLIVKACFVPPHVLGIKPWLSILSHCFLRLLHYAWQNSFDYCYVIGCPFK